MAKWELVVARYNEPVRWVRNTPEAMAVRVYNKGPALALVLPDRVSVHARPNLGKEAETYLHHIVEHYDDLAPVTVFCQGHPFDHAHDLHHVLRGLVAGKESVHDFRWLGFIIDSDDPRGRRLYVPWSKNPDGCELNLHGLSRALFGRPAQEWTHFYVGAQFAVSRECVRRQPRELYALARELALKHPLGPECYERIWDQVFGVRGVAPDLLGGELTRYLKPIRRLGDGRDR